MSTRATNKKTYLLAVTETHTIHGYVEAADFTEAVKHASRFGVSEVLGEERNVRAYSKTHLECDRGPLVEFEGVIDAPIQEVNKAKLKLGGSNSECPVNPTDEC